jgi:hypothetical protein
MKIFKLVSNVWHEKEFSFAYNGIIQCRLLILNYFRKITVDMN